MRVIAGIAKGRKLGPVPAGVRPVSDRVREGVFSSLGDRVVGSRVLDLYAGTGAMAIEALSRGAAQATIVERSRPALAALRDNLDRTRLLAAARVVAADVPTFLSGNDDRGDRFDLAFVDPPYEAGEPALGGVLASLGRGWLDDGDWTVVVTRGSRNPTVVIPVHWRAARRLAYGDSLVILFRPDRRS